ncbi:MAG: nuclear transport factor 2 family protein [Leptolyngbyaceae cyanobacterium SM2_5_2]|nr:nuclear transport factor 2 family protein [Leptolyngbyaceae cyanobacterium SM2_5_2]
MTIQSQCAEAIVLSGTVASYFENFNRADYQAVAALFGTDGSLHPPFKEPIVGPMAIAHYLAQEASGMQAMPTNSQTTVLAEGSRKITVKGRVKTPLFTVNVQWIFALTAEHSLQRVDIKLLASLQDLLQLNQG